MKAIWKFTLEPEDRPVIEMPRGAEILTLQMQHGVPRIWAKADTDAPKEPRHFRLFATGEQMNGNGLTYIGTFQMGGLVFHLFEEA